MRKFKLAAEIQAESFTEANERIQALTQMNSRISLKDLKLIARATTEKPSLIKSAILYLRTKF